MSTRARYQPWFRDPELLTKTQEAWCGSCGQQTRQRRLVAGGKVVVCECPCGSAVAYAADVDWGMAFPPRRELEALEP